MDKKNENIYNMNFSNKKDNLRNEIPFPNMINYQNNIFPFGPIPNIVFVGTNFLNKKRENQELSPIETFPSGDKTKRKYLYLLILYIFKNFFEIVSKNSNSKNI